MQPDSIGLQLLAKLVVENRLMDFSKLEPSWFYQSEEKGAHAFIQNHIHKYGVYPNITTLKKNTDIQRIPDEPVGFYYDQFISRGVYNMLSSMVTEVTTLITNNRKDSVRALDRVKDLIVQTNNLKMEMQGEVVSIADYGSAILQDLTDARYKSGLTGVPSGWNFLDSCTGGFQAGDVYVFLGRPKSGKSQTLINMASSAYSRGHIPLFISMEMSGKQIARRLLALRAGIDLSAIRSGKLSSFGQFRLTEAGETMKQGLPLYLIEGQFKRDTFEIGNLVHALMPAIVFIDGGYLVKPASKQSKTSWERITETIEDIKFTAMKAKVPIVVSYQFNRSLKKNESAGFEHIQLADAIGQIASVAVGITDVTSSSSTMPTSQVNFDPDKCRKMQIIGGREGESGEFLINWDWERMNFSEVPALEQYGPTDRGGDNYES